MESPLGLQIIKKSIADRGALIHVPSLEEAVKLVNQIAPEHLEVAIDEPQAFVKRVRHAGAIFIGNHSGEVVGDYTSPSSQDVDKYFDIDWRG